MNPKHVPFILSSYALAFAVLLWNWLAPRLRRARLRRELTERDELAQESE